MTVIDVFSKFAWAVPVKTKSATDVSKAMSHVLNSSGRAPKNLQTDNGKEFYNAQFRKLMEKFGINLYSTFSNLKASIVERFNRTLKSNMWQEFSLRGSYRWTDILSELLQRYNERKHSKIKMAPADVTKDNEWKLLNSVYSNIKVVGRGKYKVGDNVRISKHKSIFQKGYTPNWTTEIFKIAKVQITNPVTYKLEDSAGHLIPGGFYEHELQKTKHPDVYLVEKVLKKKGSRIYVKWLGLNSNTWIDKKDIV